MKNKIAIVGAGVLGRLLSLKLNQDGWNVSLFDKGDESGSSSCSYFAAGMLTPYAELEKSEPLIVALGVLSLKLWPELISKLETGVYFQNKGSLIIAHRQDHSELQRLQNIVKVKSLGSGVVEEVIGNELRILEPGISDRFQYAIYLPHEGQVDNREVLLSLGDTLSKKGVDLNFNSNVEAIEAYSVKVNGESKKFDLVLDCRGFGAKDDLPTLRGVRGEIITVHAPEVNFSRPIRVMNPRFPIYVVPKRGKTFVIGATQIESEDAGAITVQSTIELLSAAFSIHSGFAEAKVIETSVGLRPAFSDNLPKIIVKDGLIRINGLFRHGFLVGPAVVEIVSKYVKSKKIDDEWSKIFREA